MFKLMIFLIEKIEVILSWHDTQTWLEIDSAHLYVWYNLICQNRLRYVSYAGKVYTAMTHREYTPH